jgi:CTP synthase (UTP-ammonia lyase)
MARPVRFSVVKHLAQIGLLKTLIAVKSDRGYAVSRIKRIDETIELKRLGVFSSEQIPVIGRVGIPDPQLGVSWQDTMTFYGNWFDELGGTDAGYHLRKSISSISHERLLEQIKRDDEYALVGSYYAVFRTVMDVKRRVPLVLVDDTLLSLTSFPVILPAIGDVGLDEKLQGVLRVMLKADTRAQSEAQDDEARIDGIEVDEVSAEDLAKHLPRGDG